MCQQSLRGTHWHSDFVTKFQISRSRHVKPLLFTIMLASYVSIKIKIFDVSTFHWLITIIFSKSCFTIMAFSLAIVRIKCVYLVNCKLGFDFNIHSNKEWEEKENSAWEGEKLTWGKFSIRPNLKGNMYKMIMGVITVLKVQY